VECGGGWSATGEALNSAEVQNKFQASLYLALVNLSKHGKVINELQHQYINKQDNYPNTPEDAMTMLSHRQDKTHKKKFHKEKDKSTEDEIGIANFAQQTQSNSTKKKSDTKDNNNSSISLKQSRKSITKCKLAGWHG
jgi:hypothetical protein